MKIIELLILTLILVLIAVLALSIRIILTKKGEFRGGSCNTHQNSGINCGCGGANCN